MNGIGIPAKTPGMTHHSKSLSCSLFIRLMKASGVKLFPRETLRQGDGFEHGLGFVHRFVEFAFGRGIIHPAAARLDVSLAAFDEGRANGDAAIEIAVERKITHASPVRPAPGLLKLG